MMVAAAIIGGAVIAGGVSAAGTNKAVGASKDANAATTAEQRRQYDQTRADFSPYREVGAGALTSLADIYGIARPNPLSSGPVSQFASGGTPGLDLKNTVKQEDWSPSLGNKVANALGIEGLEKYSLGNTVAHKIFDRTKSKNRPLGMDGPGGVNAIIDRVAKNPDLYDTDAEFKALIDAQRPGAKQQIYDAVRNAKLSVFGTPPAGANGPRRDTQPVNGQPGAAPKPVDRFAGFMASPGYQFRLDQGNKAIARSASARGKLFSGDALKATADYSQGVASDEWGRFVNGLQSLAGVGQTATGSTANAGQNSANVISASNMNTGNAIGSSYLNGAAGVNNAVQGGLGNWMTYRYGRP